MQIVVVDSSRVVLQIIASLIEPRGHAVHAFTDSAQALQYLSATPDIVNGQIPATGWDTMAEISVD